MNWILTVIMYTNFQIVTRIEKKNFIRSLESVNEHKATGKENTVIKILIIIEKLSSIRSIKRVFTRKI